MRRKTDQNTSSKAGYEGNAGLLQFLDRRILPLHERGPKAQPVERRKISRNARRLIKRILARTSDDNPVWSEGNEDVANALKVDRSTVVRTVKRLRLVGVLQPLDTTGGRGRLSQYLVNRMKAQAFLRHGYWGVSQGIEGPKRVEKEVQEQVQANKPGQEIPADSPCSTKGEAGEEAPHTYAYRTFNASLSDESIDWDPLEWLAEKTSAAAGKLAETLRNPLTWKLIGHAALFTGICTIGSCAIYKVWSTKGEMPALALSVPVAFTAYSSWKLVDLDLELRELEGRLNRLGS